MQMSARTAKAIYQDDQQFDLYNASSKSLSIKRQNSTKLLEQRANANLTAIMNLVEIQISYEEDGEILTILENHKANLLKIIKKKAGKESNFKTIENKTFSELQNKFSSLEKAVDQKLNTILTSIENNQSITNSWAKIAIPNIQKE